MVQQICQTLVVSERRACKILGQARATQRHHSPTPSDEKRLTEEIITLATKYGRYPSMEGPQDNGLVKQ